MDDIHAGIVACYIFEIVGIAAFLLGVGVLLTGRSSR